MTNPKGMPPSEPSKGTQIVQVGGLLAIFALFRLYYLDNAALSLDESITRIFVMQPWSELGKYIVENDMHPPTYFAFAKLFQGFGHTEFGLRFGSWLLGVLSLVLMYFIGRNIAPDSKKHDVGLICLVLTGLSFNLFEISQSARSYGAMFFAATLCAWSVTWLISYPEMMRQSVLTRGSRRLIVPMFCLAFGIAFLTALHNVGVFYAVSIGGSLVLLWLFVFQRSPAVFIRFAIVGVAAFAIWSPNLSNFIRQVGEVSHGFWAASPTIGSVTKLVLRVFGHGLQSANASVFDILIGLIICLFGSGGALLLLLRKDFARLIAIVAPVVLVLTLLIVVSLLVQPILIGRLLFPALAFFIPLLAITAGTLEPRLLRLGVLSITVLIFATGLGRLIMFDQLDERYNEVLATVTENSSGVPLVIAVPNSAAVVLDYHREQGVFNVDILPAVGPFPMKSETLTYPTGWVGVPALNDVAVDQMLAAIPAARGDVWIMLRNYWPYDEASLLKAALDPDFCYQLLLVENVPYLTILKLIPRTNADDVACTQFEDDTHFPFMRGRTGQIPLIQDN